MLWSYAGWRGLRWFALAFAGGYYDVEVDDTLDETGYTFDGAYVDWGSGG